MNEYRELLPVAIDAVAVASAMLRDGLPGVLTAKGDRDMASDLDFKIEREVRSFLQVKTPGIRFLGEEEGVTGQGEMLWSLDPIDGTVNFLHGIPLCGVSLGLVHNKQPVLGVIELPYLDSRYTAVIGDGTFVNGHQANVSETEALAEAVVSIGDYAVGNNAERKNQLRLAVTHELASTVLRVRMNGSAATDLAWLAEGKLDASITLSNNPWDTSAGVIIAREAGARVVDRNGKDHTFDSAVTIACTPAIVPELIELVRRADAEASAATH
jgi:myo-inositol-1(or 4)-monophosphatase